MYLLHWHFDFVININTYYLNNIEKTMHFLVQFSTYF